VHLPISRVDLRDEHGREPAFGLARFLPVIGDDVLPQHPLDALKQGAGTNVELLIGSNREEMNLYFVPTKIRRRMFRPLAGWLVGKAEPRAQAVLRAYGLGRKGHRTGDVFTEALHDLVFRLPARRFAAAFQGRVHMYEFDWRSPACSGELGACHGIELPFVFDTLETTTGPRGLAGLSPPQDLADRVHALWVAFATSGELPWPRYDAAARAVYQLQRGEWISEPDAPAASIVP
jgi:para-nitrobenzyl esterase